MSEKSLIIDASKSDMETLAALHDNVTRTEHMQALAVGRCASALETIEDHLKRIASALENKRQDDVDAGEAAWLANSPDRDGQ